MLRQIFTRSRQSNQLIWNITKRFIKSYEKNCEKKESFIRSTVIVQEDEKIIELPVIIKKLNDIDVIQSDGHERKLSYSVDNFTLVKNKNISDIDFLSLYKNQKENYKKRQTDIETEDVTTILYAFDIDKIHHKSDDKYHIVKGFNPMENIIAEEINCHVALRALKKLIQFENNENNKTQYYNYIIDDYMTLPAASSRNSFIKQLIDVIVTSNNCDIIVEALISSAKDKISFSKNFIRDELCDEVSVRATNGQLSLQQLIDVIRIMSLFGNSLYRASIDSLWMGIKNKEHEITSENLISLFKILPLFNESKDIIEVILLRYLMSYWWKFTGTQMANIIISLGNNLIEKTNAINSINKWANTQMISAPENDIIKFIYSLTLMNIYDIHLEKSLEKFVQTKANEIINPAVISCIMNYCKILHIRNPIIFNNCAKYLMKYAMQITPRQFATIFIPFGYLNYQIPDSENFWKIFDKVFTVKFLQFSPNNTLDILLSCIYLQHYPINLANKIFSLNFINKINNEHNPNFNKELKMKLKLFDKAMSIECKEYIGDLFPLNNKIITITTSPKLKRIVKLIHDQLIHIAGGKNKLSNAVILGELSTLDLYVIDAIIHPMPVTSSSIFIINSSPSTPAINKKIIHKTAILIHLPDHYCRNTTILIGPQIMKLRHLRKLGLRVMTLNYMTLLNLCNDTKQLFNYLSFRYVNAEEPLINIK
ncbi:hypothetical protein PV326_005737 [Microctonus aethiopoides]|nr:hypothetical protein PV326_005737 [Microctonus aethiopoides]